MQSSRASISTSHSPTSRASRSLRSRWAGRLCGHCSSHQPLPLWMCPHHHRRRNSRSNNSRARVTAFPPRHHGTKRGHCRSGRDVQAAPHTTRVKMATATHGSSVLIRPSWVTSCVSRAGRTSHGSSLIGETMVIPLGLRRRQCGTRSSLANCTSVYFYSIIAFVMSHSYYASESDFDCRYY